MQEQRSSEEIASIKDRIGNIDTELQRLSKGEDTVRKLIRRGAYDEEEAAGEILLIRNEVVELKDERSALTSQLLTEQEKQMRLVSIEQVTRRYRKNFESLTYDQKRELYQEVIKKIWIKGNKIRIDVAFPKLDDESGTKGRKKSPLSPPKSPSGDSDNLTPVCGGPRRIRTSVGITGGFTARCI